MIHRGAFPEQCLARDRFVHGRHRRAGCLAVEPLGKAGGCGRQAAAAFLAAGMSKPIADLLQEYQEKYKVKVEVSYDGSGKLLSTIRAGSCGDLYLAADASHIRIARKDGLVAEVIPAACSSGPSWL